VLTVSLKRSEADCAGARALSERAVHQDAGKGQAWPHRHVDRPDRLETGGLIEPFSVPCRKAVQLSDAALAGVAQATRKQGGPNSSPHPLGMGRKVADVCFRLDDFAASRPCCRPASTSDKMAGLSLRNVVAAGREQYRVGAGHERQGAAQQVAVIASGQQARIACREQGADRIRVGRSGDPY